jgi:hypothetical protein
MINHDRLFKLLLGTFFADFLELFFPELAEYLDKDSLAAQDKEILTDLTQGETHEADMVFKARVKNTDSFFLVHVETQAQHQPDFPARMFSYFSRLLEKHALKVYPIVVFSFERPHAPQPCTYKISFPDLDVLRFQFRTVQLNRLDWKDYDRKVNPLAAALMAKMRIAPADRWLVEYKSMVLLASLNLAPAHAKLISEFFDTYLKPDAREQAKIRAELKKLNPERQEKIMEIIETSWSREAREEGILLGIERGRQEGLQKGLQEGRHLGMASLLTRQLVKQLGELDGSVLDRLQRLEVQQLEALGEAMFDFNSADDLTEWLQAKNS